MMDRASISVDTITSPAISKTGAKTGKPGFEPGFPLFKAANQKKARWRLFLFRYLEQARSVSLASVRFLLPGQPAEAARCWLASLVLLAHCSKIVFGVLEVIFRRDPIPG